MQRKLGLSVLLVVGVLAAATSGVVLATSSDYDIDIVDGIETPTKTLDIKNVEYEIDELGVIEPGDTIAFDVTSPDDYEVLLYTTDEQIENTVGGESSERFTVGDGGDLDISDREPGTYMLSLEPGGDRQAVAPVVVQGYDLSLAYPSTVEADSEVTFEATAEPLDGTDRADEVTVVIWDGEEETEITLEQDDGTTYEATRSPADELDLEPGTYDVYGAVFGDDEVDGYPNVLAANDGDTLTVTDGADDTNDDGDEDDEGENSEGEDDETTVGGPGGGSDDGNESDDGTDEDEKATSDEEEGNETSKTDESNETTETDDDDTETDDDADDDGAENDDSVLEPNDADDTAQTDTDDTAQMDGLGTPTAILSVIALAGCLLTVAVRTRR